MRAPRPIGPRLQRGQLAPDLASAPLAGDLGVEGGVLEVGVEARGGPAVQVGHARCREDVERHAARGDRDRGPRRHVDEGLGVGAGDEHADAVARPRTTQSVGKRAAVSSPAASAMAAPRVIIVAVPLGIDVVDVDREVRPRRLGDELDGGGRDARRSARRGQRGEKVQTPWP